MSDREPGPRHATMHEPTMRLMSKNTPASRLWKLSSMGFTFVSMIIAGGLLGWLTSWLFGQSEHERAFIVSGAAIGIIIGMVDFIRDALQAVHEDEI